MRKTSGLISTLKRTLDNRSALKAYPKLRRAGSDFHKVVDRQDSRVRDLSGKLKAYSKVYPSRSGVYNSRLKRIQGYGDNLNRAIQARAIQLRNQKLPITKRIKDALVPDAYRQMQRRKEKVAVIREVFGVKKP